MKKRELINLGIPKGDAVKESIRVLPSLAAEGMNRQQIRQRLQQLVEKPGGFCGDPQLGGLAELLLANPPEESRFKAREQPVPYREWGTDLDANAVKQMEAACRLPVSVQGALMPDAHLGYGLPIGGVLGVENAVIPYAVGMDIACRMKLTVVDLTEQALTSDSQRLIKAIEAETRFGVGVGFKQPRQHAVMDEDWSFAPFVAKLKDKAYKQLGSSGSGNHFVEFGCLTLAEPALGLDAGRYVALLSHSGSRGTGAEVAKHYSRLAQQRHPELSRELQALAWLHLDWEAGQEYWQTMQLMGRYAAANHYLIHHWIVKNLGLNVLAEVENHHNFAWEEEHAGKRMVVHRKGATPAGKGTLAIIPGSMATPGYVVVGKGEPASLHSASHGAGRKMSRNRARKEFSWHQARRLLRDRGVKLISAGLDEVPMAYKDIDEVMAAQRDLVEIVARFDPKLVKMAPAKRR